MPPKRKHVSDSSDEPAAKKQKMSTSNIPKDPLDKRFPTVFDLEGEYESGAMPKTLVELKLMQLSACIREKRGWVEKLMKPEIKKKWIAEMKTQGATDEEIKYVFDELEQHFINLVEGVVVPSPVDGVYQADDLIPNEICEALLNGVAVLENVDDSKKDWHPNSNDQVLDLVHPSLFPYISGVSRVTDGKPLPWKEFLGAGEVKGEPEFDDSHLPPCQYGAKCYRREPKHFQQFSHPASVARPKPASKFLPGKSETYQWLPSEFKIAEDGKVKIDSYINNLHPHVHSDLYKTLEQIFERFVPLYNKALTEALHPRENRIVGDISYPQDEKTEEDFDDDDEYHEWYRNRQPIQPQIPTFEGVPEPKTVVDLKGRTVQVITKLANIHLTPEKPEYDGGVWHVEGMENERIIATGIYYYDTENITESKLEFRLAVREPDYEQGDDNGVDAIYGLRNEEILVQPLGGVLTEQGRCIVFPNLYQHKVKSFKLADPKKPGHRKILCFFLVDPATPVLSTARVPPQQAEWFRMEVDNNDGTLFDNLPNEIREMIMKQNDWPMSLDAAKKHREELMKERKFFFATNNEEIFERPFSLCEH
eukprot:TRINITY_DN9858_c0_g1_i1.p1 TRINITY_DN9858_c0_g1~~TRINITY_DN9858_c0_g1_i1.p1  ORF type:complete len:592 (-),score=160.43 TRINITY_DN9858_c0_g1_i1:66-1841(-)